MTRSQFLGYVTELEPLRAERKLEAASVVTYPHLKRQDARRWWGDLVNQARSTAEAASRSGLFKWNGQPVSLGDLKANLFGALGRGLRK